MKDYKNIENEIEKTLNSLDNYNKRKAQPFLYTRIQAKLDQEDSISTFSWFFDTPILKPVFAALILILNIFTVWQISLNNQSNFSTSQDDTIEMFVDEYAINQSSESYFNFYEE